MKSLQDCTTLSNGVNMPWFGLGVYKAEDGEEVIQAVKTALDAGYRSIDTAALYKNERGVGQAAKESGISREEIFITTKVWNDDQGYDETLRAFDTSMEKLGLDYVDLYLVHWPVPGKFKETWRALEHLYEQGRVRAIGVSNFLVHHLEDLLNTANIKPMVNQVEFHPHLTQNDLYEYCKEQHIQLEAWAPLKRGQLFQNETIVRLAEKYDKTPAQIILRWDLEKEVVTIPKSTTPSRIIENANIFDFTLTEDEVAAIDKLNKNERTGPHPDHFPYR